MKGLFWFEIHTIIVFSSANDKNTENFDNTQCRENFLPDVDVGRRVYNSSVHLSLCLLCLDLMHFNELHAIYLKNKKETRKLCN